MTAFKPELGVVDPAPSMLSMSVADLAQKAQHEDLFLASNQLCGCLFGRPDGDAYYLGKWAVSSARRGEGIARALLEAAKPVALQRGFPLLRLGTRIELHENHRIFRALGFSLVGSERHAGFTRATAFIFEQKLV
jgi:GNAT superfamily N-acetyltransferase